MLLLKKYIIEVSRIIIKLYDLILHTNYNITMQHHSVIFGGVTNSFNVTFIVTTSELTSNVSNVYQFLG